MLLYYIIKGSSYEGHYYMGMKHGIGIFVWADDAIYKGQFLNNNIHGEGIYKY
jgi:hypothetical protein